jgi:ligand-binding sensor domain-containing protein
MLALGSQLLVPTNKGLSILRGMSWYNIVGSDGLCYEDATCVADGFDRDYWVGTTRGAIRVVNGEYHYFGCDRWIPNEKVNAIACGENVVYIATDGGLGIIRYEPYTLQKKAAWYKR